MNRFTYSNNNQHQPPNVGRKGKLRSLEALEEALFNEVYEQCAELIKSAKAFGADQPEIQKVLNAYTTNVVKRGKIKGYASTRF